MTLKEKKREYDIIYNKRNKERDKERRKTYDKQYRELNKTRLALVHRNNQLKRDYGITLKEYNLMYENQQGLCSCCNNTINKSAHVDHNHFTGKVRSLLCSKCNFSLGHYENSKIKFEIYLNKYDSPS